MTTPQELIEQLLDKNHIEQIKKAIRDEQNAQDDYGGAIVGTRDKEPQYEE